MTTQGSPSQPPEELRQVIAQKVWRDGSLGAVYTEVDRVAGVVLGALFDACEVREQSHMWFVDGTRSPRYLVLWYPLPDEPMPEPDPMPPALAAALERARAAVSSTGEGTDRE